MAAVLVLEPIFEADLEPEQHAYRPERSALDAVRQVERLLRTGHTEVVDADLSGYFDSIPHAELMKSVSRRICDGRMLRLLKMWLETPVEETDAKGNRHRTTRNKDQGMGTPQGAPISPLLSNIYMRRFVKGWKTGGHEKRLVARIVNYADDFVICCKGTADEAMTVMRGMMSKLKLTVNETKTRLCRLPDESFDFLGYTLGRNYDCRTGESYLGPRPSRKKIDRLCREIGELTTRRKAGQDVKAQVGKINRKLKGWSNYFRHWDGEQSLPQGRRPRLPSGTSVVVREIQGTGSWKATVPRPISVPEAGIMPAPTNVTPIVRGRTCEAEYQYSLVRKPGAGKRHARICGTNYSSSHTWPGAFGGAYHRIAGAAPIGGVVPGAPAENSARRIIMRQSRTAVVPPAPTEDNPSTHSSAALGDLPRRTTRSNSQRSDPRRRPTTGEAFSRQGGDA